MNLLPEPLVNRYSVLSGDRLKAVAESGLVGSLREETFDAVCAMAATIADTPIALVTVLDESRQFFKASIGLEVPETPVEWSFCQHALASPDKVLNIGDALLDERVKHSPLVTGPPHIRAYLGAPLVGSDKHVFGTLCVIDRKQRVFTDAQQRQLAQLGSVVAALIDGAILAKRELERVKHLTETALQQMVVLATHEIDVKAYADTDGVYRYVNQAFSNAFLRETGQIVGRHIADLMGQDLYDQWVREPFTKAVSGERSHYRRLAHYPAKGLRWIDVDLIPVKSDQGQVQGIVLRSRDIHDAVMAQQTIERRLANQRQFSNVLAHDVREPLRTLQGFLALAIEEGGSALSDEVRGFLRQAQRGGKRLSELVDELLEFLRADGEEVRTESVHLQQLCESVTEDLQSLIQEHQAVVVTRVANITVQGSPIWLRLLLQNLIVNGIKYARPGVSPVVNISTNVVGDTTALSVEDNGIGIAPEDLAKVFRPFARLEASHRVSGVGLGLALCEKIAQLHDTRIEVESVQGTGSKFSISLSPAKIPQPSVA